MNDAEDEQLDVDEVGETRRDHPEQEDHVAAHEEGREDPAAELAQRVALDEAPTGDRRGGIEEARQRDQQDREGDQAGLPRPPKSVGLNAYRTPTRPIARTLGTTHAPSRNRSAKLANNRLPTTKPAT